jgi:hypothetical protein
MPWPKWIKDHTLQWLIVTFIAIMAIIIPLLLSAPKPPSQSIQSNGESNVSVQVDSSPGAVVQINKIDPEEFAKGFKGLPEGNRFRPCKSVCME